MAYTVAQLNTMTPQARASYYVDNLTAAQKRGPLTSAQSAELAKYRTVAAGPAAAAAPTMNYPMGANYPDPSKALVVNNPIPTGFTGATANNYSMGGILAAMQEAASKGFPQVKYNGEYWATNPATIAQVQANIKAATTAPAGGNASSLVPAATQTSNVTPQGSGTQNATAPTDTGTGAAVTSGASSVTGAGGGFDAGYSTTGTTTGGSGLTTADMAMIAIGAGGLLLAMRKKGKG